MRVTIKRDDISEVLSRLQGLTGKKTSLAITENILIKTQGSKISISATDLETGFEGLYEAEVHDPGEIAINARKFTEIVKNFPTDDINIQELENRWIEISSSNVEYHIVGMDPEDFPRIPKVDNVDFTVVESLGLKRMIEKSVAIAVSTNEKKPHMIGVLLTFKENDGQQIVRMISTDLKRLGKVDLLCGGKTVFTDKEGIIIPKKGLTEVYKFLENDGNVEIGIKENHFIVKKENEYAIVNILDGGFPPYEELLQTNPEYDIVFDRSRLMMMLKRMSILTSEDYKGVLFHLNDDEFTIRTVNAILGESKETMGIAYDGDVKEVAYNPRYFLEAVNFITQDTVVLNIRDDQTPCIIKGDQDSNYINVIMPMKI